jgi:ribonuclease G
MGRNTLVINCDIRETRVALIEDGVIAELQIERAASRSAVGNIVLGRVTRVLPGMQAAFIDIGMERAAFLHVEDLIRPDDFEAYLYGGAREDADVRERGTGGRRHGSAQDEDGDDDEDEEVISPASLQPVGGPSEAPASTTTARTSAEEPLVRHAESDDADTEDDEDEGEGPESNEDALSAHAEDADDAAEDADEDDAAEDEEDDAAEEHGAEASAVDADEHEDDAGDEEDDELVAAEGAVSLEGVPGSVPEAGDHEAGAASAAGVGAQAKTTTTVAARIADDRNARGGRRRRRRRRGRKDEPVVVAAPPPPAKGGRDGRKDGRRDLKKPAKGVPARVSRSVPITEVVREGDEVIVQVSKEPIGTKGARVTSHVSLPGRYAVYLPTVEHVGISKRIGSARERSRLREVIDSMKPEKGGLIVRTVAEGLTKKSLKADVGYLIKLWAEVSRKRDGAKAPSILYSELDLVLKTARDLFTDDIEKIVIDDKDQHARLLRFVEMFMPERAKDIELYQGGEPVFDAYGIEDEIGRALSRKVPLPSGGYLIIDQAEALSAIDVNTGRFVGKGSKDLEETALKTNLEAVEEIAYQLRFRNIGGLVILDLIDMDHSQNRDKVFRELERQLAKDKAKTTINRISELGLIEMTRKRTRESLSRMLHEPCFYCDGTGQIMSRTTIGYEILRQIRRERESLPGYSVVVNAHPAVVDLMTSEEKAAVEDAERRYMRRIDFVARREYHIEQFDLQGK